MKTATARYPVTVSSIESYFKSYMSFPEPAVALPLALYVIATHLFEMFDAFPYVCITASTKQAGKTRLAELMSFVVNNPFFTSGATAASIFHRLDIDPKSREHGVTPPTVFFDEAEEQSKGDSGSMRSFLNSGYRKGQTIPRVGRDFPTYCPKVFILIGDVYSTLRDRSIVITLRRGEAPSRFLMGTVQPRGNDLREAILADLDSAETAIFAEYDSFAGLPFLTDRDEEIWTPLFCIAQVFCPERIEELKRIATDLSTEKTAPARRHVNLAMEEEDADMDHYSRRLLADVRMVVGDRRGLWTVELLAALYEIPTAPWRKFRGSGLTDMNLADMLSRFPVKPKLIRRGGKLGVVRRGYLKIDVEFACQHIAKPVTPLQKREPGSEG